MNVQNHIQILLGYLEPVHLGNHNYLILGFDHYLLSPPTPFVSYGGGGGGGDIPMTIGLFIIFLPFTTSLHTFMLWP